MRLDTTKAVHAADGEPHPATFTNATAPAPTLMPATLTAA